MRYQGQGGTGYGNDTNVYLIQSRRRPKQSIYTPCDVTRRHRSVGNLSSQYANLSLAKHSPLAHADADADASPSVQGACPFLWECLKVVTPGPCSTPIGDLTARIVARTLCILYHSTPEQRLDWWWIKRMAQSSVEMRRSPNQPTSLSLFARYCLLRTVFFQKLCGLYQLEASQLFLPDSCNPNLQLVL